MPLSACPNDLTLPPRARRWMPRGTCYTCAGRCRGTRATFVYVRDAVLVPFARQPERPLPTHLGPLPGAPLVAPARASDPYDVREN